MKIRLRLGVFWLPLIGAAWGYAFGADVRGTVIGLAVGLTFAWIVEELS